MLGSSLINTNAVAGSVERPSVFQILVRPIKWIAFWAAVVLPFLHLSLLATGLENQSHTLAFVVLLVTNVFALYIGHPYGLE